MMTSVFVEMVPQSAGQSHNAINMAYNSEKVVHMTWILAIVHIIVGFILFCFGIADLAVDFFWTGYGCFGIWSGLWVSFPCDLSSTLLWTSLIDFRVKL